MTIPTIEQKQRRVNGIRRTMRDHPIAVFLLDEHIIASQAAVIDDLVAVCAATADNLERATLVQDRSIGIIKQTIALQAKNLHAALAKAGVS